MLAKATRLGVELKFHDIESEKVAALKRQESDIKKLQMIKELTATTAEIEAVAKLEEEDYERDLPEEEDPYSRMQEYLQSQLSTVIDNSSSTEAVSNLGNVVTTVSSGTNAHTNMTFSSMPPVTLNSQQPSSKFLHPAPPPFTVKPTAIPRVVNSAIIHSDSPTEALIHQSRPVTKTSSRNWPRYSLNDKTGTHYLVQNLRCLKATSFVTQCGSNPLRRLSNEKQRILPKGCIISASSQRMEPKKQ